MIFKFKKENRFNDGHIKAQNVRYRLIPSFALFVGNISYEAEPIYKDSYCLSIEWLNYSYYFYLLKKI